MQPGAASNQPPDFPSDWCGLWKDNYGKVMFIRRIHGKQLAVSFARDLQSPFHPLPDMAGNLSRDLPGLYLPDMGGAMHLRVDAGAPGTGTYMKVHFIFGEGDRLRPAENWDMVSGVIARPSVDNEGSMEGGEDLRLSWAYPLSNFWKMDELEAEFCSLHGFPPPNDFRAPGE